MAFGERIGITMSDKPSFSTRRGFVGISSLAVLSLYGLWVGLGAGPNILQGHSDEGEDSDGGHGGGHGGHGGAPQGPSPEEFRRQVEAFVTRFRQPDGSVAPGFLAGAGEASDAGHDHSATPRGDAEDDHAKMGHTADEHAAHVAQGVAAQHHPADADHPPAFASEAAAEEGTVDVYLMAYQWGFEPSFLRLEAGQPYRFRMMAVDSSHGAAIQLGSGSLITRLRQGVLVEREITFTQSGTFMIYCTVYCGVMHDRMAGKIVVG